MNNVKELNTQKMQQIIGGYSGKQCIGAIGAGIGTGITGGAGAGAVFGLGIGAGPGAFVGAHLGAIAGSAVCIGGLLGGGKK